MTDRETPGGGLWNLQSLVTGEQPAGPPPGPPPPGPPPPSAVPPPVQAVQPVQAVPRVQAAPSVRAVPPASAAGPRAAFGGHRRLAIVLGAAAAVLLAAAVTTVSVHAATQDPPPVAEQPAVVPEETVTPEYAPDYATPTEPAEESTPEPTVDDEQAALAALEDLHSQDLPTVTFDGRYAAQLASKNPGIRDDYQTTASGSHVFQATDILAEHRSLRSGTDDGTLVVLLKSTDYGKRQEYRGAPLWVTFAIGDFADRAAVLDWCASRFAELSGQELANQCAARKLEPGR
jgi:hypothetical protein